MNLREATNRPNVQGVDSVLSLCREIGRKSWSLERHPTITHCTLTELEILAEQLLKEVRSALATDAAR
jgi:hypothetical protein